MVFRRSSRALYLSFIAILIVSLDEIEGLLVKMKHALLVLPIDLKVCICLLLFSFQIFLYILRFDKWLLLGAIGKQLTLAFPPLYHPNATLLLHSSKLMITWSLDREISIVSFLSPRQRIFVAIRRARSPD